MKLNLKRNDPVRERYNNFPLLEVVKNNIALQSINRALALDFDIPVNNIKAEYFLSEPFKLKFAKYSEEDKARLCKLLGSMRQKELLEVLDTTKG